MSIPVRDLIKRSLRKLAVVRSGGEPTGSQAQDALDALQSLYREFVGQGVFGRLNDVLVTTDTYNARENERVVCNNNSGVTVTLPETITSALVGSAPYCSADNLGFEDGYVGDYGWGYPVSQTLPRPPRDSSVIVLTDIPASFENTYLYDAQLSRWVLIDSLTLDSDAPLGGRYANGIAAILAVRLAPEYNMQPPPSVVAEANAGRYMISHKRDRSSRPVIAEYF